MLLFIQKESTSCISSTAVSGPSERFYWTHVHLQLQKITYFFKRTYSAFPYFLLYVNFSSDAHIKHGKRIINEVSMCASVPHEPKARASD